MLGGREQSCCGHTGWVGGVAKSAPGLPASIEAAWNERSSHAGAPGAAPDDADALPFFVMLGLMGGECGSRALPSCAGSSMPRRFDAPIVGHGRSALFLQDAAVQSGPSIPSGRMLRPESAPVRRNYSAASRGRQADTSGAVAASSTAAASRQARQKPPPSAAGSTLQTLDRVLQRELAFGKLGVPSGNYGGPPARLPAPQQASISRERGKSKMREMTMIPKTMRNWETGVERKTAVQRGELPRGYSQPPSVSLRPPSPGPPGAWPVAPRQASLVPAAASATGQPPQAPPKLTPYEMRRFLKSSQRYFLSCRPEAFAVGSHPHPSSNGPAPGTGARLTPTYP